MARSKAPSGGAIWWQSDCGDVELIESSLSRLDRRETRDGPSHKQAMIKMVPFAVIFVATLLLGTSNVADSAIAIQVGISSWKERERAKERLKTPEMKNNQESICCYHRSRRLIAHFHVFPHSIYNGRNRFYSLQAVAAFPSPFLRFSSSLSFLSFFLFSLSFLASFSLSRFLSPISLVNHLYFPSFPVFAILEASPVSVSLTPYVSVFLLLRRAGTNGCL